MNKEKGIWYDADAYKAYMEFMEERERHMLKHWAELFPWLDRPCEECTKLKENNGLLPG